MITDVKTTGGVNLLSKTGIKIKDAVKFGKLYLTGRYVKKKNLRETKHVNKKQKRNDKIGVRIEKCAQ